MSLNQENANQNRNEIPTHTCQNGYHPKKKKKKKKNTQITSVGEDVEKREPLYISWGGNVNWCSHFGKYYGGFQKTKNRTTK